MFEDLDASFNTVRWSNGGGEGDDPMLAAGGSDGFIRIWNVNKQSILYQLNHDSNKESVNALSFSPDNKLLASGGRDFIIIWSLDSRADKN